MKSENVVVLVIALLLAGFLFSAAAYSIGQDRAYFKAVSDVQFYREVTGGQEPSKIWLDWAREEQLNSIRDVEESILEYRVK